MFNAAPTTWAIDVDLPHCGTAEHRRNARAAKCAAPASGTARIAATAQNSCAESPAVVPANAGTHNHRLWNMGPRLRGDDDQRDAGPTSRTASHPLRLLAPLLLLALVGIEQLLAQPDRFRRDLDQFVVGDIGERLLQRHLDRRDQPHRLVLRMGADIGELLALEHVNLEVVALRMLAHDHAAINLASRLDQHRSAVLQVPQRVGDGFALVVGDQYAVAAAGDLAAIAAIAVEQPVHDGGAAGVGQKLAVVADKAARRRVKDETHAATARGAHLDHLGFALGELLHDDTGMRLVDVDDYLFDRLVQLAVRTVLEQHLRPRY